MQERWDRGMEGSFKWIGGLLEFVLELWYGVEVIGSEIY